MNLLKSFFEKRAAAKLARIEREKQEQEAAKRKKDADLAEAKELINDNAKDFVELGFIVNPATYSASNKEYLIKYLTSPQKELFKLVMNVETKVWSLKKN